jgi:hypothetical protein
LSAFHKQGWSARLHAMGDESEAVFDEVFPKNHKPGLNRPPMSVARLTLRQRYTPDRLDYTGYAECMGLGRDQILKIKVEKIEALLQWSATDPVDLFVWDKRNKRWCRAPIGEWLPVLFEHGEPGVFPEGKVYVGLRTKHMPFDWSRFDSAE